MPGEGQHEPRLEARQVDPVEGDAVALPLILQDESLDEGLARIGVRLVIIQQSNADIKALATVFSAGPQPQLGRVAEVMAAFLFAPFVAGVLPGNPDPAADITDIAQLDTGTALVWVRAVRLNC